MHQNKRHAIRVESTAVVLLLVAAAVVALSQTLKVRRMYYTPSPIADRLISTDEIVVITTDRDVAVPDPPPTAAQVIELATRQSDAITIVDVRTVEGVLVREGSWIDTVLQGTIAEVVKQPPGERLSGNAPISIEVGGGQVTIGKVIVRTDYIDVFKANRQYLVFTRRQQDGAPAGPDAILNPLLIEDGTLVSTSPDANERKLHGLRLADVMRDIRRAMN